MGFFPKSGETFPKCLPAEFFLQLIGHNWVTYSLPNEEEYQSIETGPEWIQN